MKRYAIWGAGTVGKILYRFLKNKGIRIDFFIDENKSGKEEDVPIKHPSEVSSMGEIEIILSLTCQVYYEIPSFVKKFGVEESISVYDFKEINIVTLSDFIKMYPDFFKFLVSEHKFLWWEDIDKGFSINNEKTDKIKSYFIDERSKYLFYKHLCLRKDLSSSCYPFPDDEPQYFIKEVLEFFQKKYLTFVDVGAYKGDTAVWLFNFFGKNVKNVYTFEPSLENQKHLVNTLKKLSEVFNESNIINIPLILSENISEVPFLENKSSSCVKDNGMHRITMPLDYILYNANINFIKIDVEGHEIKVLKGMRNIILNNKPLIAIAVYHKISDIIDIPLFILENFDFYKFILRQHRHFGLETILYCVPEEA